MLRAKQRLSAAFSRRSLHTSDEKTMVGSPLRPLGLALVIPAIFVRPTNPLPVSRKLAILVNGRDVAEIGDVVVAFRPSASEIWSIDPPLHIMPGDDLEIRFHHKRSLKHPARSLADAIHLSAATLAEVFGQDTGERDEVYEHRTGAVHMSVSLRKSNPIASPQGSSSGQNHYIPPEEMRPAMINSTKTLTLVLERLTDLQRIDTFAVYSAEISQLHESVNDVIKPIETCPATSFDVLDAISQIIVTVATTLALAVNAFTFIKQMIGPGPDEPASFRLEELSKQFMSSFRRAIRSVEERKDEAMFAPVYDVDDARSRHNQARPNSSDSRSTLSMDQDRLIEMLDPHFLPTGYPTSLCMEGTRVEILGDVASWLDDYEAPNLLWLQGGPGMGKNTLVWTIANMLERKQRNASFFFFRHQHYTALDLWRTVACSLAWYHPILKTSISANLDRGYPEILRDVSQLFESLVADPLRANAQSLRRGGVAPVLVIGSLDGCIQTEEQKRHWHALLRTLAQWLDLPKECKLVFTSCHHEEIEEHLGGALLTKRINIIPEDSRQDILSYVERRALSIQAVSVDGPEDEVALQRKYITRLVEHAAGFFLWACAAMDHIASSPDPPRALETLATRGLHQKLDDVDAKFDLILEDAFDGVKPPGFRATLGALSLACRPVSIVELQDLLGPNFALREPAVICARLSSVFDVVDTRRQRIRTYHPAFTAYLTDARRVGSRYDTFLVEPERVHRRLARSCLQRMLNPDRGLHLKMRPHELEYVDVAVPSTQLPSGRSSSLEYACQFWHEHLLATTGDIDADVLQCLNDLFRAKLLFWIEVMSVLGIVDSAVQAMMRVARRVHDQDPDLSLIVGEAGRFVLVHTDAILSSATHIYSSALAFLPTSSVLYPLYSYLLVGIPRVQTDPPVRLQPVLAVHNRQCDVKSVCVASDGTWMLVALQLNAQSGSAVLQKVDLHTGATLSTSPAVDGIVLDVKLYLDGEKQCAASAVTNGTIMLWCLADDIRLLAILKGHEDYVRCVDVDQTGSRLVSGADDCTLIVWSMATQALVGKPFTGHKDWIRAVLFTEDGLNVVSGSDDKSIRIWDTATGVQIRRICVHGSPVLSMALCASGLISGSDDGTIVVTALDTGLELNRQSRAHCAPIRTLIYDSVAAHGVSFVSGAADGTVQLWDRQLLPLNGRLYLHKSSIVDVARVDHYFASAAEDGSIVMWDPWAEAKFGSPPYEPQQSGDSRMGPVLLVQASEDDNEVYAVDTHGVWRWSSSGNLLSRCDFISEHGNALGPARAVALSVAGRKTAISLAGGVIYVVDTSTGHVLHGPLHAHDDEVNAMAMSVDGEYFISAAADGSVQVRNIRSVTPIDPSTPPAISLMGIPDLGKPCVAVTSTHFAYASEKVHLYAHGSVDEMHLADNKADIACVHALNFADDGFTIGACYSSGQIAVWDIHGGTVLYSRAFAVFPDGDLSYIIFDGALKAVAYINHPEYCIINLHTGEVEDVNFGNSSARTCAVFSRDGRKLIVGSSDGVIRVADREGAARYIRGPSHEDSVRALACAPDGRFIASGDDSGRIVLWDVEIGEQVNTAQPSRDEWIRALIFTPDGKYLLSAGDDCTIRGWHVPSLESAFEPGHGVWHSAPVRALALSSDGHTLVTGSEDSFACIWELSTDDPRPVLVRPLSHPNKVLSAAVSQDAASLVTGSTDGSVHLWLRSSSLRADWSSILLLGHSAPANALTYLSDSKVFVSGGEDRTLRLWDAKTGAALRTIQAHDNVVHAVVACNTIRTIFSASRDATIRAWDAYAGEEAALPVRIHPAPVLSLALSPDGKHLISGDSDGRVIIHDVLSSLRAWPQHFQRSVPGLCTICSVDKNGVALGAQLHEDGWLRGRRGETLLWIPPAYRPGFCGHSCCAVLGMSAVMVDLREFVHGNAWSSSITRPDPYSAEIGQNQAEGH